LSVIAFYSARCGSSRRLIEVERPGEKYGMRTNDGFFDPVFAVKNRLGIDPASNRRGGLMQQSPRRRNVRDESQAINERSLKSVAQEDSERQDSNWIAQRAYQRYEERGREDGHDTEDWLCAEQEFRTRFNGGGKYPQQE
jgi:hypothetical protein